MGYQFLVATFAHSRARDRLQPAVAIAQALLSTVFLFTGAAGVFAPISVLAPHASWIATVPPALIRFIGVAELSGAMGLALPTLLEREAALVPWAAIGLGLIMLLAAGLHATLGEPAMVAVNVTLLGLAAFVAWGRVEEPSR